MTGGGRERRLSRVGRAAGWTARAAVVIVCGAGFGFLPVAPLLAGRGGETGAAGAVTERLGAVTVDWTAGRLVAAADAAADPRAPDAEVARVAAERLALERARTALAAAARRLPVFGGGTVGVRAEADAQVEARLSAAVARARAVDVAYASDGGAHVTAVLPLEAVRLALTPAPPPVPVDGAPTALVIDATGQAILPMLGFAFTGAGAQVGPTVWVSSLAAAQADPRVGARPLAGKVTGVKDGKATTNLAAADWELARAASALIVVVTPGKTTKSRP
jgi:hypothetical protein